MNFSRPSKDIEGQDENIEKESPMTAQTITKPAALCNVVFSFPSAYPTYSQPILASSLDYGFDFDEEELGRELLAPLPASLEAQPNHRIEAEEFESLYRWFNS
jgi:hypothetical protein